MIENNKNSENNKNKNNKKKKSNKNAFIMLGSILFFYTILYFAYPDKIEVAFKYSTNLIINVLPILLFVFVAMLLFNMIHEDKLKKMVTNSSRHLQYLIMTILGTISHGPIYA